nr:MAG TPA: hypothetical protein [Caudoviricetes sp.]
MFGISLSAQRSSTILHQNAASWLLPTLSFQNKMRHKPELLRNLLEKSRY